MKEVTYWEADDGTQFEYEDECREYEWKQKVEENEDRFFLLDSGKDKLDPYDTASYDDTYFIYIPNKSSAKVLYDIWDSDITGVYPPDFLSNYDLTPGLWAFDDTCDEWFHLGERIAELQDIADKCMEKINEG